MTDYKQLCAELLDELEYLTDWSDAEELKSRARAALAAELKELALGALYAIATGADDTREFHQDLETIKQALESLPD